MKLAMSGALLKRLVERALKSVSRKDTIPILTHLRIEALAGGAVMVTGTNQATWTTIVAPGEAAEVEEPGATCLPGKVLDNVLKKLPDGDLSIDVSDGKQAVLKAGRAQFKIHVLPAEDFPAEPGVVGSGVAFSIPADHLTQIATLVSFAMSSEEARYYLNGIYLHPVDGRMVAVATNGHVLSKLILKNSEDADLLPDFRPAIVHRDTIDLFATIAEAAAGRDGIEITVDEARIRFDAGDLRVVSKLVDGQYPDYSRVIPIGNPDVARIDREALAKSVERVRTISAERGRVVAMQWADDELRLQVRAATDEGEDVVACDWSSDEPLQIGANGKYLSTILDTFDGEEITFAFAGTGTAMVITDERDPDRTVILMPMRV